MLLKLGLASPSPLDVPTWLIREAVELNASGRASGRGVRLDSYVKRDESNPRFHVRIGGKEILGWRL
jgi:hypothetical protein